MLILETGFLAFQASLSGDSSDEEQRVAESKEPEEPQRPATWSDDDVTVDKLGQGYNPRQHLNSIRNWFIIWLVPT